MVIPPAAVTEMMDAFGRLGTRHAVVISAGFKETGDNGATLESELLATARKHGMRFLGPNCMGVIHAHFPLNFTVAPAAERAGASEHRLPERHLHDPGAELGAGSGRRHQQVHQHRQRGRHRSGRLSRIPGSG